jgi:hypothetical protein
MRAIIDGKELHHEAVTWVCLLPNAQPTPLASLASLLSAKWPLLRLEENVHMDANE